MEKDQQWYLAGGLSYGLSGLEGGKDCKVLPILTTSEPQPRSRPRTPNNRTTTGFRISDELWTVLQPLLPAYVNTHRFGGGRPRVPDCTCADAIFFVLRTGCQWRALDQTELCAHSTAHDRFQVWVEVGSSSSCGRRASMGLMRHTGSTGIGWRWTGP